MTKRILAMAVSVAAAAGSAGAQGLDVPPGRWWERPEVVRRLDLEPEQQRRLESLAVEHARRMIDLKAAVEKAELELRLRASTEPFEPKDVRESFAALQQVRSRLEAERFELLIGIRQTLAPEQWRVLRELGRERRGERPARRPGPQLPARPRP
jgi:Spy/CpxP family protein refolding chaperone